MKKVALNEEKLTKLVRRIVSEALEEVTGGFLSESLGGDSVILTLYSRYYGNHDFTVSFRELKAKHDEEVAKMRERYPWFDTSEMAPTDWLWEQFWAKECENLGVDKIRNGYFAISEREPRKEELSRMMGLKIGYQG